MILGTYFAEKIHPKIVLLGFGLIGPFALWLSSFMPNFYAWWACYLVAYALVNGLTYMTPVHHAWLWFPERSGLASGIIMSGFGLSGLIFNNIALFLVNP